MQSKEKHILLVQIYVEDIIFGYTNESFCKDFTSMMHSEFEMSMMREPTSFFVLHKKQAEHGTFISQTKHCLELLISSI